MNPQPLADSPPAPRISSPLPMAVVTPSTNITVTFTSNSGELDHEITLLDADFNIISTTPVPGPIVSPKDVAIPAGKGKVYYLVIGVKASQAKEQTRHCIRIRTAF